MNWVKTYESYIFEAESAKEIAGLEKLLKLPANSGVFKSVAFDKMKKEIHIEQPTDLSAMDAGAIITAINKEKNGIKKLFPGAQHLFIGDLQIKL